MRLGHPCFSQLLWPASGLFQFEIWPLVRFSAGILFMASLAGCSARPSPSAQSKEIAFESADGFELRGSLYAAAAERPPSLILIHMLGSSRAEWEAFALEAQDLISRQSCSRS